MKMMTFFYPEQNSVKGAHGVFKNIRKMSSRDRNNENERRKILSTDLLYNKSLHPGADFSLQFLLTPSKHFIQFNVMYFYSTTKYFCV